MNIKTIPAGIYEANCYIVSDEATGEAVVMDPGGDVEIIEHEIEKLGARVKSILLTHGHFDHVGGVVELSKQLNVPFYISKTDEEYMDKDTSQVYGKLPKASGYLKEGTDILVGDKSIKVLETPGHTKGGLCFLVEDNLFTGDTLFKGSIGRTDFIGGSFEEIIKSIEEKLIPLGDDIKVYPGHGPMSTIGFEKRNNPYLE